MSDIDNWPKIEASNEKNDAIKSPWWNKYLKGLQRGFTKAYDNVKTYFNSDEYEKKIWEELKPKNQDNVDKFNKNNPFYIPKK